MVQDVGDLNWKLKTGFFSKIISTASKTGLTRKFTSTRASFMR